MGERSKLDVRGFESPKLPKQAKYIYGFVTKNHGLYNKKSPIKSDFFAVTSFLHNHYGGRRWIRTIEAKRNRFTVCPLWPLGNSPLSSFSKIKAYCLNSRLQWSWWTDLNPRPADYKSAALPTELHQRIQLSLLHSLFNFECLYSISHSSSFVNTFFKFF